MLGMLGLFGALLAGVVADSVIGGMMGKSGDDTGEDPVADEDPIGNSHDGTDMLNWADGAHAAAAGGGNLSPDHPDYAPRSNDNVLSEEPDMVIDGGTQDDIMSGRNGNDDMAGGDGADQMVGQDGTDYMQGGAGADIELGGADADTLLGGSGNDLLQGGAGNDQLIGGEGDDTIAGHDGADQLYGSAGNDTLLGGTGFDRLDGGTGADWLAGGTGADTLTGGAGGDTLDGGNGHDVLDGRDGAGAFPEMDFLNGGGGDDLLHVGAGDHASGGGGADWFELSDMTAGDAIANIADYDAAEDTLVVVFDPAMHPDPVISLQTPENSADVIVLLDGVPLATVQGGAGMSLNEVLMTPAQAA